MLARTRELTEQVLRWYEGFEFHRIYHAVNEFAIADLSAFYLDVLKDRMYTFAPSSKARRSAQTVLWKITEALTRLLAPILSFTEDEVWDYLPAVEGREASVHLALFPKPEEVYPEEPIFLIGEWKVLFGLREHVLGSLEQLRQDKVIGKATEADIKLYGEGPHFELLRKHRGSLKELFNVSGVYLYQAKIPRDGAIIPEIPAGTPVITNIADVQACVLPASGHKCARCWNFMPEVSNYGVWENVCTRCHGALKEMRIEPPVGNPQ